MKVYRYEHHETGEGPYTHLWKYVDAIANNHSDESHPSPYHYLSESDYRIGDPWPIMLPQWICGCESQESLSRWFRGWEVLMQNSGFIVREYDIPDHDVIGPDPYGQVVFFPVSG